MTGCTNPAVGKGCVEFTGNMSCGQSNLDGTVALCDECREPSLFNMEPGARAVSMMAGPSFDIGGYVNGQRVTP